MKQLTKFWPFGDLTEGQPVLFSDGSKYIVKATGWKLVEASTRARQRAERRVVK